MKLTITIRMDNAAFDNEPITEVGRILREYADSIEEGDGLRMALRDINGNTVGQAKVTR